MREESVIPSVSRPILVVGVTGASCTGKSMLTHAIARQFRQGAVALLDMDGYHKHDRQQRKELQEEPDVPAANKLDVVEHDLAALRRGCEATMPVYDHNHGRFAEPQRLSPTPLIFVEGLHAMHVMKTAYENLIDLNIFLDPEEDLRKAWKIRRDVAMRSYAYDEAVQSVERREPLVRRHILPQREDADIIISILSPKPGALSVHKVLISHRYMEGTKCASSVSGAFHLTESTRIDTSWGSYSRIVPRDVSASPETLGAAFEMYARKHAEKVLFPKTRASSYRGMIQAISLLVWLTFIDALRE